VKSESCLSIAACGTAVLATGCDGRMRTAGVAAAMALTSLSSVEINWRRTDAAADGRAVDDCTPDGTTVAARAGHPPNRATSHARSCDRAILRCGSIAAAAGAADRRRHDCRQLPAQLYRTDQAACRLPLHGQRRYICICRDDGTVPESATVRRKAMPVGRSCFVAQQRSHARDRNINRLDNELTSVGDDAWDNASAADRSILRSGFRTT